MTLEQWVSLRPEERNRERRGWSPEGGPWQELVQEACDRFRDEFEDQSLINDIRPGVMFHPHYEPAIYVVTALWPPQRIEELPDRYLTFAVVQHANERRKAETIQAWTTILGKLLDWSPERVHEWALTHHKDGLDDRNIWFYHDHVLDHVIFLLVPEAIQTRLNPDSRHTIKEKLFLALDGPGHPWWYQPRYDWAAAKARVQKIVAEYSQPQG